MATGSDSDIYSFWAANYTPAYVQAKGGVPMRQVDADNTARFFQTEGWRIQGLWKNWVLANHPNDLTTPQRIALGLAQLGQDVASGNIGSAGQDFLAAAEATAASVGRDLSAEADDVKNGLTNAARDIQKGVAGALDNFISSARNLDPAHVIKVITDNFEAVRNQLEATLANHYATLTFDGKRYAWADARKNPADMIWYLAATSLNDANNLKNWLLADIKRLFGVTTADIKNGTVPGTQGADAWPWGADSMTYGVEPITVTLIIIAVIVIARIIILKLAAPHTVAHQIASNEITTDVLNIGGGIAGEAVGVGGLGTIGSMSAQLGGVNDGTKPDQQNQGQGSGGTSRQRGIAPPPDDGPDVFVILLVLAILYYAMTETDLFD